MFSAGGGATGLLLEQPSLLAGSYPEQRPPDLDWLDERVERLIYNLGKRRVGRTARLNAVVRQIEGRADPLEKISSRRLRQAATELRPRLRREGFTDYLVGDAFALVREAARRTLDKSHYPCQLLGGLVMIHGMLAEMQTGEGKTLTAALPAATAALAGLPVHVLTANEYLVKRDAKLLKNLYKALGLRVGYVTQDMAPERRREAYLCDITYATAKQVAFDYLRDRLTLGRSSTPMQRELERLYRPGSARLDRVLMRGLCFAIVDEADSILIDEARTPLIIARPGDPKLQEQTCAEALRLAAELVENQDYTVDRRRRQITVTEIGEDALAELALALGPDWSGPRRRRERVRQALSAMLLFERDRHYLVKDDKVQIIDENTGRLMPDRSWEQGLHQLIETKEGVPLTPENETLARLSFQRFFRRYKRLSGMTGTAREVASELRSVYRLHTVRIPTHRPMQRRDLGQTLYPDAASKWRAVVQRILELTNRGRPVLVGTRSVEDSEILSEALYENGLRHTLLNARQDQVEAQAVARAGQPSRITIATNMAGRGTDIELAKSVQAAGGLHVIAVGRNEARRIDRQLFGRAGRQGDPGSFEVIAALDDDLMSDYCPSWLQRPLRARASASRPARGPLSRWALRRAQARVEAFHRQLRQDLLKQDEYLDEALAFSGRPE
jgi:preprotein translocase subunit SecA